MKKILAPLLAIFVMTYTAQLAADETTMSLNAGASLTVEQDRLAISLSVREEGGSAEVVQMAINRRMAAAMEMVNGAPEVSAKTGGYRVYYQNYHRSELKPENGEQGRWVGTQILSLDSADFEAAKTLAGELQQSGLAANHMSFYVSAELQEATKDRLIPLAVNTLKNKAKLYQQALGGEVLMLKSIQVQGAHRMMAEAAPIMMAKSGVTGDQAAPVVAEPDEQEISLTLEGKFELSPIIIE